MDSLTNAEVLAWIDSKRVERGLTWKELSAISHVHVRTIRRLFEVERDWITQWRLVASIVHALGGELRQEFDIIEYAPKAEEVRMVCEVRAVHLTSFLRVEVYAGDQHIGGGGAHTVYFRGTEFWSIDSLHIHKDYRHRGIGKQLLQRLIAETQKLKPYPLTLEARSFDGLPQRYLHKWYRLQGFKRLRRAQCNVYVRRLRHDGTH